MSIKTDGTVSLLPLDVFSLQDRHTMTYVGLIRVRFLEMRDRRSLPTPGLQSFLWDLTKFYVLSLSPFLFTLRWN